jgi:exonuclease SbcD
MSQPFRFVHTSDFHLERPLAGLAEPPAPLASLLVDAPYTAAGRVFDLAENERADFLVLAGDILHVERAGPPAVEFLLGQFERLAARGIGVYWAAGAAERRSPWPSDLKLPASVHVFPRGPATTLVHRADGDDLAVLVGSSNEATPRRTSPSRKASSVENAAFDGFAKPKGGLFAIGVIHRSVRARELAKLGIDYWACGGEHRRRQFGSGGRVAVYPGSPQGRSPAERGPHGAVVVEVDEHGTARPRFVATDVARFRRLRIELDPGRPQSENERILADRVEVELARSPGLDLFLRWQIALAGSTALRTPHEAWGQGWLRWLRQEFGTDSPAGWSVSVEVERPASVEAPQDGSLLADFLAAIAEFEAGDDKLPLATLLPDSLRGGAAAKIVEVEDARERQQVLRQARDLGRELLGAEEAPA